MPTPLRSRDNELASLHEHLDRLRTGVGTTWLIEGGAGLGKSRMLEEVISAAQGAGFAVGHGIAEPVDAAVQLAVLMDALFDGPTPLLDRSALGDSHASPEQRYWLLQDIQTLLEEAALRQPVVICLDDLQWADSGTTAAVRSLPGRLAPLPVGWVLAFRPSEADSDLGRAITALLRSGADRTCLQPLDQAAVALLAADVLGAQPDDALLALAAGGHGNPFLLIELLSGLREEGLLDIDGQQARLVDARLPRRVRDTMRRRLGRMTPSARSAAAVAASMGRRFTVADLAAVLAVAASTLLDPIGELIGSELFAESGETLSFTHDLIREEVRASQPSSAVHALDRQVASALLTAGALPVEVATQLASSAARGDEVAITTLMKASDALRSTDPGQAADLARRALDLTTERHPLRGPLVARIAVLLHAANRTDEATAFADSALREALPAEQEAEVRLSIASLFSISPEVRADSCRRALALAGVPPDLRARLLAQLLYNLVVAVRPDQARDLLGEVREAVEVTGDGAARFTLQLAEAALNYISDRFETALALVDAALRTNVDAGEDPRLRLARHFRCGILALMDRYDEAMAGVTEGIRSAQQARQGRALQLFETNRARQLLQLGQLGDAAAALEGRFSPDHAHLVVSVLDADGVVALGRIALHRGDQRQRDLTAAVARVMLRSGVPGVERQAAWLLALQAQAGGDPAQALRWLSALGEKERLSIFPLFLLDPSDDPQMVRIAMAGGDRELAESATAAAERRHEINPAVPAVLASAAHARGLLTGNPESLAQAVTILQAGRRRLALASALEDLGVAEARVGRTHEAIAALDSALAIHAACGARWDLARVRRRLRRLGVRRRLASERRPLHGWAAMTDSELAVVRLVADGLTNREVAERLYISPHTVSGHLRHAFEKLGINSRVALTRIATEHIG
ncbi:MAG: LuxR family transcriptional regulator [Chloroflexi bacterium]|nr:LuxR family transcriptional regulator [Chloroflexota bacterium]